MAILREVENPPAGEVRRRFHRKLLVFTHCVLAFVSTFAFLSQVNFAHFPFGNRFGAAAVFLSAAPGYFPLLVSGVHSWRVVTDRRLGVWALVALLIVGTSGSALWFLGALNVPTDAGTILSVTCLQTLVYFGASEFWLNVD